VGLQEITDELAHPGARKLLASATLLRLAYNGADGFPRVIPIGRYWNGNRIVVCPAAVADARLGPAPRQRQHRPGRPVKVVRRPIRAYGRR
jgi:hypothetical protein